MGLVAVLVALAMPFAPVVVNEPTVSWPQDPARPVSTLLSLTAYRPLGLDVRFSCAAARVAQANGGIVVSTVQPLAPRPQEIGLIVLARDDRLLVRAFDRTLVDAPLGAGTCGYQIVGQSLGTPSGVNPAAAELIVSRDGAEIGRATSDQLPDVDMLVTSAATLPSDGLAVTLRVDDEFTSSPTPVKTVLTALLVLALAATAVLLWRRDRTVARVPGRWRLPRPRIVDLLVGLVMMAWLFVAPATDDDGYYGQMARNAQLSGEVGNYYQLYDQSFTPFTWFYQLLAWWQQLAGDAPVTLRVPALVLGLLTWLVIRRFAVAAVAEWAPRRGGMRSITPGVLGVVFLAWWLPQNMGVRPEGIVALCGAATMLAVLEASRRDRLLVAWSAFALAGLGFAAHPTGITLFAPLLAGLPLLWPMVRVPGIAHTAFRVTAVASGGVLAALVAFADGSLRDFLRGQAIFLSIQAQDDWTSEFQRYSFLLSQIPMGNFAKRAAVLACLVALVWFAVLVTAARLRRVPVPTPLWLAGSTTALAFAALWLTPSKWTHHFGALAGVGPAFLGLMLVLAVPLTRGVLRADKLPVGVLVGAAASFVLAIALAWSGPNQWPYAYLADVRMPDLPPAVWSAEFGSPTLWLLILVVVALGLTTFARVTGHRDVRLTLLGAVPIVVVTSLAATVAYAVGTFGAAALNPGPAYSLWAANVTDPVGCIAADGVRVLDPFIAEPLPEVLAAPLTEADTFAQNAGFYVGNPPPVPVGTGAATELWGSLVAQDGDAPELTTGRTTTAWYELPISRSEGAQVTVLAAGSLGEGNSLAAVYGRRLGDSVVPTGSEEITDQARDAAWRTVVLAPPADAHVVRLEGVDATGGRSGWLAFTAPSVQPPVSLTRFAPIETPVAVAWQIAFQYPCQRQPRVIDGITEAPTHAVLWGNGALAGPNDNTWQPFRGGLFGQVRRSQAVTQLATVGPVDPSIQVYVFTSPLAREAYTVSRTQRITPGASTATG